MHIKTLLVSGNADAVIFRCNISIDSSGINIPIFLPDLTIDVFLLDISFSIVVNFVFHHLFCHIAATS